MKKLAGLLILIFAINFTTTSAQYIPKKWVKVYEDSTGTTFVDTTSIRNKSKQIIFWALKIYNQGITVKGIDNVIFRVKSQYVVNDITKRYSTLGILYYDKTGKLIGDNYNRNITGAGEIFSKPIDISQEFFRVYKFVKDFLFGEGDNSTQIAKTEETKKDTAKNAPVIAKDSTATVVKASKNKVKTKPKDSLKSVPLKKGITKTEKKTSQKKKRAVNIVPPTKVIPQTINWGIEKKKPAAVTLPKPKVPEIPAPKVERKPEVTYDAAHERFVTSSILTDGKKYVVQVSSWKNKKIAESQVEKLKALGYNAFIVSVYIPKRHGTWNRVRVGYFDTLREAKRIQRKIRKQLQ